MTEIVIASSFYDEKERAENAYRCQGKLIMCRRHVVKSGILLNA